MFRSGQGSHGPGRFRSNTVIGTAGDSPRVLLVRVFSARTFWSLGSGSVLRCFSLPVCGFRGPRAATVAQNASEGPRWRLPGCFLSLSAPDEPGDGLHESLETVTSVELESQDRLRHRPVLSHLFVR